MKENEMKNYTQAPLPFQGQKRKFLKQFKAAISNLPDTTVFVDLFGGSGLLSHTAKNEKPHSRVIYNDYDNYTNRIKAIPHTNKLLADLRVIVGDYPRDKRINNELREKIMQRVKSEPGYVDYITLSSSLLFSMNYTTTFEQFEKQPLYNVIKRSDYNADDYLTGVEIVSMDYKNLFQAFANQSNVIFLIDPPYLSTDTSSYSSESYWKLADYLDVLETLKTGNYFYFTSNKSSVIELCHWVSTKTGGVNPFAGATQQNVNTTINYSSSYTDIMLYKLTNYE